MRPSVRFEKYGDDVEAFLAAYRALWHRLGPLPQWGVGSILDGINDPSTMTMVDRVALAAGRAHSAVRASGFLQQYGGQAFDPVGDWRNSFVPGHPNTAQLVDAHCQQIIGHFRALAGAARSREGGIAGMVASFVRFPATVREAAGFSSRGGQRAAAGFGLFLQGVAIAVVGGLIVVLVQTMAR